MKRFALILTCLAFTGCGDVGTVAPKPILKKAVEKAVVRTIEKKIERAVKPKPTRPVIWSPVEPKLPAQCPDGKCPYGEVIFDGMTFWEVPVVQLPEEIRPKNYSGGSCVFASTEHGLIYLGMYDKAKWLRKTYHGGSDISRLTRALDAGNVRYAYTANGDTNFFHWCTRTRRPATIFYYPNHSVTFCGIMDGYVYLLDNNRTGSFQVIPEQEFYNRWKGYGGFALAVLDGAPAPPLPWKVI